MADLEIALTYSLRKEVAGKEVIEKDDLLNLKNYINVIVEVGAVVGGHTGKQTSSM